jgi:predicted SAM-dependent methyltransferase
MHLNAVIYKTIRAPREKVRAHLGPGQKRYLSGWVNVDANMFTAKCDIWADLRYPLPFRDETAECIYSHHVIEHLPNLRSHFDEVYRCLEPGGVYRVGGPNGDAAIEKFIERDTSWFSDFPEKRRSIGGRFENFIFCKGERLTILTQSFLTELLKDAGFENVCLRRPMTDTGFPELFQDAIRLEHGSDMDCPHTLLLEAVKP